MRGRFSIGQATLTPVLCCLTSLISASVADAQCSQHNGNGCLPTQSCPGNPLTQCCKPVGPDVIIGDIQDVFNVTISTGTIDVFSFGTTSCAVGSADCAWEQSNNTHPVVGQNLFKMRNNGQYTTFQQLGQSWLKHTFCTLAENVCGCTCSVAQGSCSGGAQVLHIGCSDPYTANRNAGQTSPGCGPKWQVNASNGNYPYPPANPSFSGSLARRLQVKIADLEVSNGTSIRYFAECQYVTADDAAAGNKNNNTSYREVSMSGGPTNYSASLTSGKTTQRERAGLRAWHDSDPNVKETDLNLAGDGLFIVSAQATSLGGNMWHYEYAVQNVNSDQSGQAFSVPLPAGINVTNVGFHDVDYHDGDGAGNVNWDGTDWTPVNNGTSLTWSTSTFAQNSSANALRWGTMYNFRFDADKPPVAGNVKLTTFKVVNSYNVSSIIPSLDCNNNNVADATDIANHTSQDTNMNGIPDECETAPPCAVADFNGNHTVDIDDLLICIGAWGQCQGACPPACMGDVNHNCTVDIDDLLSVIGFWGPCQ